MVIAEKTPENLDTRLRSGDETRLHEIIAKAFQFGGFGIVEREAFYANLERGTRTGGWQEWHVEIAPLHQAARTEAEGGKSSLGAPRAFDPNLAKLMRGLFTRLELDTPFGRQCAELFSKVVLRQIGGAKSVTQDFFKHLPRFLAQGDGIWAHLKEALAFTDQLEALQKSCKPKSAEHRFANALLDIHRTGIPTLKAALGDIARRGEPIPITLTDSKQQQDEPPIPLPEEDAETHQELRARSIAPNYKLLAVKLNDARWSRRLGHKTRQPHWDVLRGQETNTVMRRLSTLIRPGQGQENELKRLAAGICTTGIHLGISLHNAWGCPIRGKPGTGVGVRGGMHINLAQGLIRRRLKGRKNPAPRTAATTAVDLQQPPADATNVDLDQDKDGLIRDRETGFCGLWWRTYLPQEVLDVLREHAQAHQHAQTLGELAEVAGLTYEFCIQVLNDGWTGTRKPHDLTFCSSLGHALATRNFRQARPAAVKTPIRPSLIARITGDVTFCPFTDHYYLAPSEWEAYDALADLWRDWGFTPCHRPEKNRRIGSAKALRAGAVYRLVRALKRMVGRLRVGKKATLAEIYRLHTVYAPFALLMILWGLGARMNRVREMSGERVFALEDWIIMDDRRLDEYSMTRLCASNATLLLVRTLYLAHLRSLASRLRKLGDPSGEYIQELCDGKHPQASMFVVPGAPGEWRSIASNDLLNLVQLAGEDIGMQVFSKDMNTPRHVLMNMLHDQNVDQLAIDAFVGHHTVGGEPMGPGAGSSGRELGDQIRPYLDLFHREIGLEGIAGLGHTTQRHQKLIDFPTPRKMEPVDQEHLEIKLRVLDIKQPEARFREARAPVSNHTLLAKQRFNFLLTRYVAGVGCELFVTKPLAPALFCQVAFELTLAPQEQAALFEASFGPGMQSIKQHVIQEAYDERWKRAVVQRHLHPLTISAYGMATRYWPAGPTPQLRQAIPQLHALLRKLDPTWPDCSPRESLELLSALTSHAAVVDFAMSTLFPVFGKAPFIEAADYARMYFGRPCVPTYGLAPPPEAHRPTDDFQVYEDALNTALRPGPGSATRMREFLAAVRKALSARSPDLAETHFVGTLCATAKNDGQGVLGLVTLKRYMPVFKDFFTQARRENHCDWNAGDYAEFLEQYRRRDSDWRLNDARYALRHIARYLATQGFAVPVELLSPSTKQSGVARFGVYTRYEEVLAARELLPPTDIAGTRQLAGTLMLLFRSHPTRRREAQDLCVRDVDLSHGLLHIVPSANLKTDSSSGSFELEQPALIEGLKSLINLRAAHDVGASTLAFADAHRTDTYAAFLQNCSDIQQALATITGRPSVRIHDLRASAVTDFFVDVHGVLTRMANGTPHAALAPLTPEAFRHKSTRLWRAACAARHGASPTTLRYYNMGALLALADERNALYAHLHPSPALTAALAGRSQRYVNNVQSKQAAAAHSDELSDSIKEEALTGKVTEASQEAGPCILFRRFVEKIVASLPSPVLQDRAPAAEVPTARGKGNRRERIFEACLLRSRGYSLKDACSVAQAPVEAVERLWVDVEAFALDGGWQIPSEPDLPLGNNRSGERDELMSVLRRFAAHLAQHADRLRLSFQFLRRALDDNRLVFHQAGSLHRALCLLEELAPLGFRCSIRFGKGVPNMLSLPKRSNIKINQDNSLRREHASVTFGRKSLIPDANAPNTHPGSRAIGRVGPIVTTGFLLALLYEDAP